MATAVNISNNKTERIDLTKPFKGFTIGLVTQHDTAATAVTTAMLIDPHKVILTLRNRQQDRNCFQMPLDQLYRFTKFGDKDLYEVLANGAVTDLTPGGSGSEIVLQNLSLDLFTYHGDYELIIECRDSMKANTKTNSYVTVLPVWSDDPMTYEVVYNDYSLDKSKFDKFLGSGIEQMVVMNLSGSSGTYTAIEKISYSSIEQSQDFNCPILVTHSQSYEETAHQTDYMTQLMLHDGEVLTNLNVSIEMRTPSANWILMYQKLYPNPNAQASAAAQEYRQQSALDNISA